MAHTIALFTASPIRRDALTPLRVLLSGTCALALILAGQPLPF